MRIIREALIIILGLVALVYLANPTAGIIEILPDNLPIIGNLDEAGAVLIIVNTLRYYGIDAASLLGERRKPDDSSVYDATQVQDNEWE